jgi:SNF2 family DNA or RNA helicase
VAVEEPSAELRLEDDRVIVVLDRVEDPRLDLFFEFVLTAEENTDGWSCPVHYGSGADWLLKIARELQTRGYSVAGSGTADTVLDLDLQRIRSFKLAGEAASGFLGLDGERRATLDESEVLAALEKFGWDHQRRELLAHQRVGLMHALSAANAANFSVPGAGKTATALAVAATHLAQGTIEIVVVVGPLSSFRPWEREADIALPGVLTPRRIRALERSARAEVYRGVAPRELLLLSYATAAHDGSALEELFERRRAMLIVDESHRVKRFEGGLWAPALVELARFARVRMILTGTPMPQGPKDLWSQFNILWPGEEATGSRGAFRARARSNFDSIKRQIEPFFTRTPKSELKLKEAEFFSPPAEMPSVQAEIYELVFGQLRTSIPDAASWAEKIERLRRARPIRLIQAASNPDLLNTEDGFFEIPPASISDGTVMERLQSYRQLGELPAKFQWTLDFLEQLKAAEEKCVVWTTFVRNIEQFATLVEERLGGPAFRVHGRIPAAETADPELNALAEDDDHSGEEFDETREAQIDNFLSSEGFAVLVANPAACAESISLHSRCFRAAYLDRTYDCARWLQSIDRIHRLGLPAGVTVEIHVPLAMAGSAPTVDDLVDTALREKETRMKALLNDAELRGSGLDQQDSIEAAEGSEVDLEALLRHLLGEAG